MKKIKSLIYIVLLALHIIGFCVLIWELVILNFFPWSRTNFSSQQKYKELLNERGLSNHFMYALPESVSSVNYYFRQEVREKHAAYSFISANEEFGGIAEERVATYYEFWKDCPEKILYLKDENERCTIDDLKNMGVELDLLRHVLHDPQDRDDIYCLILIQREGYEVIRYMGVLANDSTCEIIEFCIENPIIEESSDAHSGFTSSDLEYILFYLALIVGCFILFSFIGSRSKKE